MKIEEFDFLPTEPTGLESNICLRTARFFADY